MRLPYLVTTLGLTVLLAACGEKAETGAAAVGQPASDKAAAEMDGMAMPAEAKPAKSTGTVVAIDKAAGKITLKHEPIPEVDWPAMTMAFDAKPGVLESVAVGDKVAFDVTIKGNAGEVTVIQKQ